MRIIETTGKTVEEAIEDALSQLGADRDEALIDVVSEGRGGVLGIGSEPAVVRVTLREVDADDAPDDDNADDAAGLADADAYADDAYADDHEDQDDDVDDEPQPAELSEFAPPDMGFFDDEYEDDFDDDDDYEEDEEEASEVVKVSYDVLGTLLDKMSVSAEVYLKEAHSEERGGPVFEIEGEDSGLLIGSRGETLRALQFVASFLVSRRLGARTHMFVDVEGYQQRRYNSVINLARRVARRVAQSGRPIALEPMPPDERRQVHMALADHADVITESDGYGDGRRVVIHPDE